MLLFILCLTGISFAQQPASEQKRETVDETSLVLFPEETADSAEDGQAVPAEFQAPSSVGAGDLIRVIVVLAAVIAAIYGLVYFLRKFSPLAESEEDLIAVLATRHLKKDSSLHLIEVGNQVFLIGSGSSSVSLISEITDQETMDKIRLDLSSAKQAVERKTFRSILRRNLPRTPFQGLSQDSPDFLRSQRDRLKNLRGEE